jgi:hypothetical protein
MLGIGRSAEYELVRTGQWPEPVLRLGGLIRVPTAPLLELLGERIAQLRECHGATTSPAGSQYRRLWEIDVYQVALTSKQSTGHVDGRRSVTVRMIWWTSDEEPAD